MTIFDLMKEAAEEITDSFFEVQRDLLDEED
jgi:hypothetical protein|nr:MAG TPA: hypothetical protein [Bacteriophage sp.]